MLNKIANIVILGVLAWIVFLLALLATDVVKQKTIMQESTQLIATVHIGEHFIGHCDNVYFVLPYMASTTEVRILQGSDEINRSRVFDMTSGPVEYVLGCYKIRAIADPASLYMLEVYRKP